MVAPNDEQFRARPGNHYQKVSGIKNTPASFHSQASNYVRCEYEAAAHPHKVMRRAQSFDYGPFWGNKSARERHGGGLERQDYANMVETLHRDKPGYQGFIPG